MSINLTNAETFAAQFNPPLTVAKTDKVNNVKVRDAYMCAYWDKDRKMGVTAVFHDRQIKAYIEAVGPGQISEDVGRVFAAALGLQPDI